jgi:hypothetical protein
MGIMEMEMTRAPCNGDDVVPMQIVLHFHARCRSLASWIWSVSCCSRRNGGNRTNGGESR